MMFMYFVVSISVKPGNGPPPRLVGCSIKYDTGFDGSEMVAVDGSEEKKAKCEFGTDFKFVFFLKKVG